ncbi:MAG: hypothetical protein LBR16_06125 [Treponema sp.]|nr:hypothetical protein [Treponema sp.]
MSCNTCFVLGAGFSAPAGIPPQKDLLRDIARSDDEKARRHIQDIFGLDHSVDALNEVSLEDVFTFLDKIISRNGSVGVFNLVTAYQAKGDLINYIVRKFNASLREMRGERKYEYFFNAIANRKIVDGETNTIVTFNWDTIPDFYITRAFKFLGKNNGVDYGCYDLDYDKWVRSKQTDRVPSILRAAKGYKTIKVLKPHGSINWAYQKDKEAILVKEQTGAFPEGLLFEDDDHTDHEHVLMTPTFTKDLSSQHIQSIWQNIHIDMEAAKRILFLAACSTLNNSIKNSRDFTLFEAAFGVFRVNFCGKPQKSLIFSAL